MVVLRCKKHRTMQQDENNVHSAGNPQPKKNTGRIVLISLLLASLVLNIYQFYERGQRATTYEGTIDSMAIDQAEVDRQLQLTKAELEQYRGRSEQLDSLLNDANGKIAQQEERINALLRQGKKNSNVNAELRKELEELKKLKDQYLEEIDRLITENKRLQSENDSLSVELSSNVSVRNKLEATLKVAEQLRADRVKVTPMKKRAIGGKAVPTSLAKKTERIDVCFAVLENAVASKGEKTISTRIISPNGKPLGGTSMGSFRNAETGEEMQATSNQRISYDGSTKDMCLTWEDEDTELEKGEYGVEIYIDGVLVFSSSFKLE